MTYTKHLEQRLEELTAMVHKLQAENANIRHAIAILEDNVETLEGHGFDLDGQIEEINRQLKGEEKPSNPRTPPQGFTKPHLRLV